MVQSAPDAVLAAQLDYLRSDARIRERVATAASLRPEERLAQALALGRLAAFYMARLPDDVRARAAACRAPLGPGAEEILLRLAHMPDA
ncbi:MAG: hypothetical protein HY906_14735 [Deltaproteobacteria bacterium]|nr:hypothetical protein [Deltaproteobacteria bacterium]